MILLHIAADRKATMREIAQRLQMTGHQVARIIKELSHDGVIRIERQGRRNVYTLNEEGNLRQPRVGSIPVKRFVQAFLGGPASVNLAVAFFNSFGAAASIGATTL